MRKSIMSIYFAKQRSFPAAGSKLTDTSLFLIKAQSGEIPIAALEKVELDQREVSLFLARELLFWYSAAEGAKMSLMAALFYELHRSLLSSTKHSMD
jgi:hypothetical protein